MWSQNWASYVTGCWALQAVFESKARKHVARAFALVEQSRFLYKSLSTNSVWGGDTWAQSTQTLQGTQREKGSCKQICVVWAAGLCRALAVQHQGCTSGTFKKFTAGCSERVCGSFCWKKPLGSKGVKLAPVRSIWSVCGLCPSGACPALWIENKGRAGHRIWAFQTSHPLDLFSSTKCETSVRSRLSLSEIVPVSVRWVSSCLITVIELQCRH